MLSQEDKPFRPQDLSPMSNYSDSRNPTPLTAGNGRPPFQMNRSATSPMPRPLAPVSPDLSLNMDNPFPPFPTRRNAPPSSSRLNPYEQYSQPSPLYAPLSPRTNGGESVVKRMDTIAPGPFDGRGNDSRPSTSSGRRTPGLGAQQTRHQRSNTQSSIRSNGFGPNQRTSLASTASRTSTFSNGSSGLPSRPKPGMRGPGAMAPPPLPPPKNEGIDAFLERLQKETLEPSKIAQDNRSRTFPMRQETRDAVDPAKPPELYSLSRRPTDVEPSGFVPRSNNMFPSRSRSNSRGGSKPSIKTDDLPPLPPVPNYPADPVHTPSDSGLSEDSYASSGFRSVASSRSSPPSSVAGHSRQASKIGRSDYLNDEPLRRTTSPESFVESKPRPPQLANRRGNGSISRGRAPEPLLQPPKPAFPNGPESPLDPAIQRGLSFEKRREEAEALRDPALNLGQSPPRTLAPEPRQPMPRRPTAAKSKCRGCSEPIVGKSVKDSSGRLTGRYHKQCFVCRTCGDPFPTAEFYVFDNAPYCEQHYHELNGSLCQYCARGIEGQYLETDQRAKFHPRCFTCSTCRVVLRDDYFEVAGRNFCERHAYAMVNQQNNTLGVGGNKARNLQKRRTRVMMMS